MSNNQDYDQNVAQDAGYAAGRAEGAYNEASGDVRRDEQSLENIPGDVGRDAEQGFDNTVQGVENVPSDVGGMVDSAAKWVGDKIGGVENEGRQAEGDVRNAEGDVDRFGDNVQGSYDQGQRQGERQGW